MQSKLDLYNFERKFVSFFKKKSIQFSNPRKIGIFGEGIINILLMDLKIASLHLKSNDSYVCPFGMKTAQHPIISLIHKKNVDMLDLANKLNGICSHFDQQ